MGKRQPALTADQLAFTFDAPPLPRAGDLAGLERMIASGVARMLKGDPRDRAEVAGAMSALLDDDVSKTMLDAYAAEARDNHNISAARLLALVAATGGWDVFDSIVTRAGGRVFVGEEVHAARLGHLHSQKRAIAAAIAEAERRATPISRGAIQ